jgi:hypothetical protein
VLKLAGEGLEFAHHWDLDLPRGTNGRASSDKGEEECGAQKGEAGVRGRGWPSVQGSSWQKGRGRSATERHVTCQFASTHLTSRSCLFF